MKDFLQDLKKRVLIADGAMGTMLYAAGIGLDVCCEHLVLDRPQVIEDIHRQYVACGADIIETNTFAANSHHLAKYGYAKQVNLINETAAVIARKAAGKDVYVAGSIGPLDRMFLENNLSEQEVLNIYREQILALAKGGVDIFILETFSDLEQIKLALSICKKETKLPVIAQMTFADGSRTSLGTGIELVCRELVDAGADCIGANCGNGPAVMCDIVKRFTKLTALPISAMPNAGYPEIIDGKSQYVTSPEYFANHAAEMAKAGAAIIGGCCGTTPQHIRSIAQAVKGQSPILRQAVVRSETVVTAKEAFYTQTKSEIIVELLPPKQASMDKLMDAATLIKNSGAQVISFPENPLAQVRMSAVIASGIVQRQTGLTSIFHYTCRDRNLIGLQSDILGAYALGLRYILAVTGDPVSLGSSGASAVFDVDSIKLVKLIDGMRRSLGLDLHIGVAFNPNAVNLSAQVKRLERKIEAGAEFVLTQPAFDVEKVQRMYDQTKDLNVPIYLGILPLVNKRNADYLHNEVPGMSIPENIRQRMAIDDKEAAQKEGMNIALETMRLAGKLVRGFYLISPLNKYEISAQIVKQAQPLLKV